jgi:outer membrane protein assembly factor BamD
MRYFLFFLIVVTAAGCKHNKILKSNDLELKYSKAIEYYEDDDCYKALPLLEELIGLVRGTQRAEDVYYYYAQVHYCIGDYYLANYYFKNFSKTYSNSSRAEECLFLAAMCSYQLSPSYSLDQQDTRSAINDFQLYMDRYPESSRRDSCNVIVDNLRKKLELKAFEVARLYVKTERFKAATIALENILNDYPGTIYTEEALYLTVLANFEYAGRSIEAKKLERYEETTKSYYNFVAHFSESKWKKEAEQYFDRSLKNIDKLKGLAQDD